jgi:hypothetical protein
MSMMLGAALVAGFYSGSAAAQAVDPAPSGRELTVISTNGRTSVEVPGRDNPVSDTHEGNRQVIDFDPQGNVGTADQRDVTIEHTTDHSTTDHNTTDHDTTDHSTTDHDTADHNTADHDSGDHDHDSGDHDHGDHDGSDHDAGAGA